MAQRPNRKTRAKSGAAVAEKRGDSSPAVFSPANETGVSSDDGVLYLVATPLGNLEDITARALRILREADGIAAEDTRVTRKLLAHFDIHTPLTAYHAHSDDRREAAILARLRRGERIALVTDAGTPCISDPGAELVAAAIDAGIRVEPIPGPCAPIAALIASGLPPARFTFEGFLPRTRGDRHERVADAARQTRTVVFFESPQRLVDTLTDIEKVTGPHRRVAVAREITKKFEEFTRGTIAEVIAYYRETPPRGECVIVLEAAPPEDALGTAGTSGADPEQIAREAVLRGLSPRDAARDVSRVTGLSRNDAYALVQRLRTDSGDSSTSAAGTGERGEAASR